MPTPVSPSGQAVVVGATGEVGAAIVVRLREASAKPGCPWSPWPATVTASSS
jgi:hypothetical protein